MHRLIFHIPGLVDDSESSVLRVTLPGLRQLVDQSTVFRIAAPSEGILTPEAAWLGLSPESILLAPGPLVTAALRAEPPDRAVHFCCSVLTYADDTVTPLALKISPIEHATLLASAARLNAKNLTFVPGPEFDHGLVWEEGSVDLATTEPTPAPLPFLSNLPRGDGEPRLRRFIDDSINILTELDMNRRRAEEGLPLVNCLWPWGQGFRMPVPNLTLRYGEPIQVESANIRLEGLSRLAGLLHGDRSRFGTGTATKLARLTEPRLPVQIAVIEAADQFRRADMEALDWFIHELDRELFSRLAKWPGDQPLRVTVLGGTLGFEYQNNQTQMNTVPFDERALDERGLATYTLWEATQRAIAITR